jgi:hypothetical protein
MDIGSKANLFLHQIEDTDPASIPSDDVDPCLFEIPSCAINSLQRAVLYGDGEQRRWRRGVRGRERGESSKT